MSTIGKAIHRILNEDEKNYIQVNVYISPTIIEKVVSGDENEVYDDQTLEEWYDFVDNAEGIIERMGDVVEISSSDNPKSLSEYISFYTFDEFGLTKPGILNIRLSDHPQTRAAKKTRKRHISKLDKQYKLISIIINGSEKADFNSYDDALRYIRDYLADDLMNNRQHI